MTGVRFQVRTLHSIHQSIGHCTYCGWKSVPCVAGWLDVWNVCCRMVVYRSAIYCLARPCPYYSLPLFLVSMQRSFLYDPRSMTKSSIRPLGTCVVKRTMQAKLIYRVTVNRLSILCLPVTILSALPAFLPFFCWCLLSTPTTSLRTLR